MEYKNILSLFVCIMVAAVFTLTGCGGNGETQSAQHNGVNYSVEENNNGNGQAQGYTTVSQPRVDVSKFPSNYTEIEKEVFKVISTAKTTKNGKTTGCDFLKLTSDCNGVVSDKLQAKVKNEIISAVNEQIEEVTCTDAILSAPLDSNSDLGSIAVYFTYNETNGKDIKIFSVSLN